MNGKFSSGSIIIIIIKNPHQRHQDLVTDMYLIRKRPFNSAKDDGINVTEEEMEAYRLARKREEDPMAQFLSK